MITHFPGLSANLLLCLGIALLLTTISNKDQRIRFFFSGLAIYFNCRYFGWRAFSTLEPMALSFQSIWQWTFFLAETTAVVLLSWHLILLAFKPRDPLNQDVGKDPVIAGIRCPDVDVFIPTLNEARDLLEPTIRAARKIDYPHMNVWVLDDGDRPWLEELCREEGVGYIRRSNHTGFKAGNLNNALRQTQARYILCIDADFVVDPRILRRTLGYFDDPGIGLVQTPQHFWNPDAIQHNLRGTRAWPEEQRVFTDLFQSCRDRWNNAFCYGTNFVVRRDCLDAVGGFPENTVSEDLFVSYLLKQRGWVTRFHNESLAIGQAAGTLNEFIKQRARWCTGTLQCLFLSGGPIRSRTLSAIDKVFFLDPVFYYLSAVWVFLLMLSPAVFWWTGVAPFESDQGHLLMMLMPRMMVSMLVLYWHTDRKVVPIVSEIGRFVGIFYTMGAIVTTLIRPFSRSFRVTLKDHQRTGTVVNWAVMRPHLVVLGLTLSGIMVNASRHATSNSGWNENIGLIVALTVYFLWMNFLSLLACVEPPLDVQTEYAHRNVAVEGSMARSIVALARKITQ